MTSKLSSGNVLLELIGVKKYFDQGGGLFSAKKPPVRAVDGVDLIVRQGETVGIVGESGCGKSTLGNLIVHLLEPTEGRILFEGRDLTTLPKEELRRKRADIQMVFQDPYSSLNPRMRVHDIIAEPLRAHGVKRSEQKSRVDELLQIVGLNPDYAKRYPHEFSGGQRQRIGIARALALQPKLIVCDEPVSALDVSIQAQILNLLLQLQERFGLTLIFIGHGIPAVRYVSDRIAVMYLGRIVELADSETLMRRPLHPYSKALLEAVPIPDPAFRNRKSTSLLEGDLPNPANPPSGCRFHPRCPYARGKCQAEEPSLQEHEPGRFVACHFPLEGVV